MQSDFDSPCFGSSGSFLHSAALKRASSPCSILAALAGAMAGFSGEEHESICSLEQVTAQSAAEAPAVRGDLSLGSSSSPSGRLSLGSSCSTAASLATPPSSAKRSSTSAEEMWSPAKVRRVARATLNSTCKIVVERLPPREQLCAENFLLYYAGALVRRAGLKPARRRLTEKQPPCVSEVLIAYASGDFSAADSCTWPKSRDRVNAFSVVSKVVSSEYNMRALEGRSEARSFWATCDTRAKNRWVILTTSQGFDELFEQMRPAKLHDCEVGREVYGCLFTWQTPIGRRADSVRELLDAGIRGERLVELMSEDEHVQQAFNEFEDWIQAQAESHGFRYYAACMEVSTRGVEAVAHLHAYLSIDWCIDIKTEVVAKPLVQPRAWAYETYTPHCVPSKVSGNQNILKVLQMGLFYCCANKIGSVFRRSNIEPFVDIGQDSGLLCWATWAAPRGRHFASFRIRMLLWHPRSR